ncbi:DUF4344 domain-containing metallopeptidase [Streptomyces syringium]|uniref:DUF4344 domain-containing metallopeptidase n=1 Tax=Streptomyces syringium TaxID=76729 RepID=UPI003AAF17B4
MLHHAGAHPRTPDRAWRARALVATGVCVALAATCGCTRSQAAASPTSGGLSVSYEAPRRGGADERSFLKDRRLPERVAEHLNDTLRLPKTIDVVGRTCDEKDDVPAYDQETRRIELCYDFVGEVRSMFEDAGSPDPDERTAGVITETLYHEAAHALKDTLRLATTGREEDVADQFAAYSLIPQGAKGRAAVLAAADNYAQYARETDPQEIDFSAEHPPEATRSANYRCYLYGAAPKKSAKLVDGTLLTKERAELCADEYQDLRRGWGSLLAPYKTDR